jgi:hypothetical protein
METIFSVMQVQPWREGERSCGNGMTLKDNHGNAELNLDPLGPDWMLKCTYITVYVFMSPGCCVTGLRGFRRQGWQVAHISPFLFQNLL